MGEKKAPQRALELAERHSPRMVKKVKGFAVVCSKCRRKEPPLQEACPVYGTPAK